jgi:hypothetical protein
LWLSNGWAAQGHIEEVRAPTSGEKVMAHMAIFKRGQDPQTAGQSTVSKIHGEHAANEQQGGTILVTFT